MCWIQASRSARLVLLRRNFFDAGAAVMIIHPKKPSGAQVDGNRVDPVNEISPAGSGVASACRTARCSDGKPRSSTTSRSPHSFSFAEGVGGGSAPFWWTRILRKLCLRQVGIFTKVEDCVWGLEHEEAPPPARVDVALLEHPAALHH